LMGWVGQGDTRNQLRLKFDTRDEAVAFCEKEGLDFQVIEPKKRTPKHKSYAENFRHDRAKNWTH
ncbi:MAG: NADH dehydrogenase ubiquinone Fe-S protein 4, partial [Alphaproteobacteria bacterium]